MKKLYVPNVPDVCARPKYIFPPVSCHLFLQNMAAPQVLLDVLDNNLVKFSKENKNMSVVLSSFSVL